MNMKPRPAIRSLLLPSILAAVLAAGGCGGGGGGGSSTPEEDENGTPMVRERLVYVADQDVDERNELFLVFTDEPGVSTKLNRALVSEGDVRFPPRFARDGEAVIYRADAEVDKEVELWMTDLAAPGAATQLNPQLVPEGDVGEFTVIDGADPSVLYVADQEVDDRFELFRVSLDNPRVATRLNPDFGVGHSISRLPGPDFRLSPDGTRVVYRADQDTDGVNELYLVDLASPGTSEKVNGALVPGGQVSAFRFSPDGQWIAYGADEEIDGTHELFIVAVDDLTNSVRLNGDIVVPGGFVSTFMFTPDSTSLVYRAEQDSDGQDELYLVKIDQPGNSTRLNPALVPGGDTGSDFAVLPDGSGVVYAGDQETDGLRELYVVRFNAPRSAVKLSAEPQQAGGVSDFELSPDGERVVYVSEEETLDLDELFLVELDTPGTSTRVSQDLPSSRFGILKLLPFRPDGERIPYMTDAAAVQDFELFIVSVSDPGNATRLNSPLSGVNELVGESEAVEFFP